MNTEQLYLIWSIEHDAWWCPLERGYTKERRNAGTYTYAEAKRIVDGANIGDKDVPNEAMIPLRGLERTCCDWRTKDECPRHKDTSKVGDGSVRCCDNGDMDEKHDCAA